jgi:methyl coenzyme M reductase subunit C
VTVTDGDGEKTVGGRPVKPVYIDVLEANLTISIAVAHSTPGLPFDAPVSTPSTAT